MKIKNQAIAISVQTWPAGDPREDMIVVGKTWPAGGLQEMALTKAELAQIMAAVAADEAQQRATVGSKRKSAVSIHDDRMSRLTDKHCEEADQKGAEFYNLGWAQGNYFIHSKTDRGRLYSELNVKTGEITHDWTEKGTN